MIISASYKTDIPTFYGEWFINRLRAGYCKTVNPFNRVVSRVSLKYIDVDGIVFWTKNIGPFLTHLHEVSDREIPFVIQHTINGYPRSLERRVVNASQSSDNLRRVAEEYGPKACVWRYDTIVDSSDTPREFHLRSFDSIARQLEGVTDEVVVSFAHIYKKTKRNMEAASRSAGFQWSDPDVEWKRALLSELVFVAESVGMQLTLCSQPEFKVIGSNEARCIDAQRLEAVSGKAVHAKTKGNRPDCLCAETRDIGEYDTCPHGCVYCYAVRNMQLAQDRYRKHDPTSEFLFEPEQGTREPTSADPNQKLLFDDGE